VGADQADQTDHPQACDPNPQTAAETLPVARRQSQGLHAGRQTGLGLRWGSEG